MTQDSPSFIIGSGRCGSTALYKALSTHPDVSWMSSLMERFPDRPRLNAVAGRGRQLVGARRLVERYARPSEAYRWWDVASPGFRLTRRDLIAGDVTPVVAERLRRRAADLISPARPNLVLKITGWPRVAFLREVFPGARFIHVVRDGRAVAASNLHVRWWDGWLGPSSWRFGPLSATQEERWSEAGRSYVALAGLGWEILMDAFDDALQPLDADHALTIRYEDLCAEPATVMRRIADFLELEWTPKFDRAVWTNQFTSSDAWRSRLTDAQLKELERCIGPTLARVGYG